MPPISNIDLTHPVGGDATNGTYGVRQQFVLTKTKLQEVITAYNALETAVAAIPDLPPSGPLGLQLLESDDAVDVFPLLGIDGIGRIIATATAAGPILDQLGFEYGTVGSDRGWIKFGMKNAESLKINWFNLDISGYTSLSYPLQFNSKVFAIFTGIHSIPDSSWGKNSSIFSDGMGNLTGISFDASRGGLKSIVAIGI